ncbi:MAG: lamin tail domain-containing protein, partial [bacterium]
EGERTMKKLRLFLLLSVLVLATNLLAQDHILITEFVVTPTAGEFIEVYNPTSDSVDLGHHYVTDAVSNNNNHYTTIVQGGFAVQSSSDFMVKFPDGTKIGPGQHITVAFSGTGFTGEYGVPADFEIKGDDAGTPDMTAVDVGSSAGLSNSGEVIIVFYWDGNSDLVKDVDIVVWGDQNEAVDKTGLKIDGIDADTDSSTYANDTPIANQYVVNADNDADATPHDFGSSAQRRLDVEDVEDWGPGIGGGASAQGGNGLTGHDETSENTSWLSGGIWSINEPATPGYRALGKKSAADSLTIADLQFLRADTVGAAANDDSRFEGDTLTVTGVVMNDIREINLGARWGAFIEDARGGPWSGFFVIQNDSTVGGTLLNAAVPGDKIKMTGVMSEFPSNTTQSITQFVMITDPATPIEILDSSIPLPDPILLKPGDLGATGSSEDPRLTERLESTLVRFEGLTVMSNSPGQSGNIMTAGDATGTIAIDDYFFVLRDMLDNQTNGEWPGFPVGTVINITGFMRDVQTGGAGRTTINPRSLDDIEIASAPPAISSNVTRDPVVVSSSASPTISTVIQSSTSTVASATLNYRVDGGAFQQVR